MNNQYPQPNQPTPQYTPPQKPYVDPAKAKKEKTDAINALGDKVSAALKTHPILAAIEKNSEIFSYIATTACALLTIVLMTMGKFQIPFGVIAVIFGFFALSKKKVLPLTISMTALSLFSLVCFINSIAEIIQAARYGVFAVYVGAAVLGMIFSLLELGAVGFLTYLAWTYHLATVPAKPVQQPYYGQNTQPGQGAQQKQGAQYNQTNPQAAATVNQPAAKTPAAPTAPAPAPTSAPTPAPAPVPVSVSAPVSVPSPAPAPVKTSEPILEPITSKTAVTPSETAPVSHKFCTSCGTENNADAVFCKNCGKKF